MDNNDLMNTEENNSIEHTEEKNIEVELFEGDIQSARKRGIKLPKETLEQLSVALSEVPSVADSIHSYKAMDRVVYSVTFDGKDVLPEQLSPKKNGSLFSNLKTKRGFGKQTDLRPVDYSKARIGNLINMAFSIASVVTSTYYLKGIDDDLKTLQNAVQDVKNILTDELDSKVERDAIELNDIVAELQIMFQNDLEASSERLSVLRGRLLLISREENETSIKYRKMLERTIVEHQGSKSKKVRELERELAHNFYMYCLSSREYVIAERLLGDLAESVDGGLVFSHTVEKKNEEYNEVRNMMINAIRKKTSFSKTWSAAFYSAALFEILVEHKSIEEDEEGKLSTLALNKMMDDYHERAEERQQDMIPWEKDLILDAISQIEMKRKLVPEEAVIFIIDEDNSEGYLLIDEE